MNLAFTLVIKKVLEGKVFPALSEVVEWVINERLKIKGKASLADIKRINQDIHKEVLRALFTPVDVRVAIIEKPENEDSDDSSVNSPR